jgi:hypothetical protein
MLDLFETRLAWLAGLGLAGLAGFGLARVARLWLAGLARMAWRLRLAGVTRRTRLAMLVGFIRCSKSSDGERQNVDRTEEHRRKMRVSSGRGKALDVETF